MRNSDSPQGIYSPLSQAMTDSESEEEIHNSSKHQRNSNNISMQNSIRSSTMTDIHCTNFTNFNSDGEERHHADSDNVAILGTDLNKKSMSTIRKCCFIISILVCILTVVIFLWVVPCGEGVTCPAPVDRIKSHWLNNYTKIELKGVVNVVDGVRSWERNLIFMYRGDKFFPEFGINNKKRNGIISLIGSSGAIAWFDEMVNEPIAIDCSLLDADKNGKPDCLVIDEEGQLGAINPVSGQWIWKFFDKSSKKIDVLDFPVMLPDLDGDGTNELLFATNNGDRARNFLRILSGRSGQPIEHGYKVLDCSYVHKFQLDPSLSVSFNCINNETEVSRFKSLSELYSLITNKSIGQRLSAAHIPQHKLYGQRKEIEAQRNIYSISGKELVVENRGKCPENCNVTFTITEVKNGKTQVISNFNGSTMYGMVPAQLSFKSKDGKMKFDGFVMKFWEWSKNHSTFNSSRQKRASEFSSSSEYNIFDHLITKRKSFKVSRENARTERSIANITKQKSSSNIIPNYKMRLIKETVVLIIFNSAHIHIENTSESNIVQFCRTDKNEVICQPDLNYQENSVLIADLDQDDSQELVSYYTTFTNKDDDKKDWKLVTYVRLLRLESELPLLYEEVKKN